MIMLTPATHVDVFTVKPRTMDGSLNSHAVPTVPCSISRSKYAHKIHNK